jgi:hypothetical protein
MNGRVDKEEKQSFYSELLHIAKSKKYNPNWASHKYREKYGIWPRNLDHIAAEPTIKTLNWIKHKNIAFSRATRRKVA